MSSRTLLLSTALFSAVVLAGSAAAMTDGTQATLSATTSSDGVPVAGAIPSGTPNDITNGTITLHPTAKPDVTGTGDATAPGVAASSVNPDTGTVQDTSSTADVGKRVAAVHHRTRSNLRMTSMHTGSAQRPMPKPRPMNGSENTSPHA